MRVLFDTNVVLDVMLDRDPFAAASAEVLSRAEAGELIGCVCATTVTTIHYLATRAAGAERALGEVRKMLSLFDRASESRGSGNGSRVGLCGLRRRRSP